MDKILPRLCIGINGKTGQYITAIDNGLIMNEEHMGGRGIRKGKRTDEPVKLATERKIKHMFNKSSIIMKQFKNLILAGALVLGLAGFAVSCDKYGDDIDELRDKVNTLASKDELSSQIASLQSALSAASAEASQASAEAATAKAAADKAAADAKSAGDAAAAAAAEANAAKAAADKAAADAKQAAIEALQSELETLKADLKEATDAQLAEFEKKVNAATEKVEALIGKVAGMVTSVELVYSYSKQLEDNSRWDNVKDYDGNVIKDGSGKPGNWYYDNDHYYAGTNLGFTVVTEKDNVFGKGLKGEITFKAGAQYKSSDTFIVRVSPANAELTPDMISLVNSQNGTLDDLLDLKVKKYDKLLTKAEGDNALWEITASLKKDYDKATFNAATQSKGRNILFAVKVNNTKDDAEERDVYSSYDITLNAYGSDPLSSLNYTVDEVSVEKYNNRYDKASKSLLQTDNLGNLAKEYTWKTGYSNIPVPAVAPITQGANANVLEDIKDNRSDKDVFPAVQGVPIEIEVVDYYNSVRAIYVVLDKANAVESAPSELNAWESYDYEGLNEVVEGTYTTITINGDETINDYIGFRVYAVNYDGTLVDPDGKAFYVNLGKPGVDWNAAATTVVPKGNPKVSGNEASATQSGKVDVKLTKLSGAKTLKWITADGSYHTNPEPNFHAYFVNASGTVLFSTDENYYNKSILHINDLSKVDFTKVTKVYTIPITKTSDPEADWRSYEDGKAYIGYLDILDNNGHVLASMVITMTKNLPSGAPAGFSEKTGQIVGGVYNCYLTPYNDSAISWKAATANEGHIDLNNVFNGLGEYYTVTFAKTDGDKAKDVDIDDDNFILKVERGKIDNTTSHASEVTYDYGAISSANYTTEPGGVIYHNVIRTALEFQTIYNDIYNSTYTWGWATREQLIEKYPNNHYGDVYGEDVVDENGILTHKKGDYVKPMPNQDVIVYGDEAFQLNLMNAIYGVSSYDKLYNAFLSPSYENSVRVTKAELTSNANKQAEYFEVTPNADANKLEFKPIKKDTESNPTVDVASTLTITYLDQYNHTHTIKLPFTVKKR